jgi:hypothetical protein
MPNSLTEEKRDLLRAFVDGLPTTPGLDEDQMQLLDKLSELILKTQW